MSRMVVGRTHVFHKGILQVLSLRPPGPMVLRRVSFNISFWDTRIHVFDKDIIQYLSLARSETVVLIKASLIFSHRVNHNVLHR